ncbi:MAG TPA: hypothetical protein PLU22_11910 [Polyangiaceae bacterium]|nr:hypothetical protein [Polyangiaceae bacterium]
MRVQRLAVLLAIGIAILAGAGSAWAQAGDPRVVILRPERTDPDLDRALVHLQGELTAAGFAVSVVAVDEPVTPAVLRRVGEEQQAFATLTVLRANGNTTADVWIGDRVTGKTSVRTLATTSSERSGKILAIRAVDLLKTSLTEAETAGDPPPEVVGVAPPEQVPDEVREFAKPRASPVGLYVHGAVLGWPPPFAPAFGPHLGVTVHPGRWLGVRVVGAALTGAVTENEAGTVHIGEQLAQLELAPVLWQSPAARLGLVAGAGVCRFAVSGEARSPYYGRREAAATFVAGLGPELGLIASPNARFAVGLRALTFAPDPVLLSADDDHPMNRFALLGTLGLEVGL